MQSKAQQSDQHCSHGFVFFVFMMSCTACIIYTIRLLVSYGLGNFVCPGISVSDCFRSNLNQKKPQLETHFEVLKGNLREETRISLERRVPECIHVAGMHMVGQVQVTTVFHGHLHYYQRSTRICCSASSMKSYICLCISVYLYRYMYISVYIYFLKKGVMYGLTMSHNDMREPKSTPL